MRVKFQENLWTDLNWWDTLNLDEEAIRVNRGEESLVLLQLATEAEAKPIYDEINRRIRSGIPASTSSSTWPGSSRRAWRSPATTRVGREDHDQALARRRA